MSYNNKPQTGAGVPALVSPRPSTTSHHQTNDADPAANEDIHLSLDEDEVLEIIHQHHHCDPDSSLLFGPTTVSRDADDHEEDNTSTTPAIQTSKAVTPTALDDAPKKPEGSIPESSLPTNWWETQVSAHHTAVTPPRYHKVASTSSTTPSSSPFLPAPPPPAVTPKAHRDTKTPPLANAHKDSLSISTTTKKWDSNTVLLYQLVNDPEVILQIRPSHSLHHLCKLIGDEWMHTFRRNDCAVEAHLWQFRDSLTGEIYERTPWDSSSCFRPLQSIASTATIGSQLQLTYDYDAPTTATLQLMRIVHDHPSLAAGCPGRYQDPSSLQLDHHLWHRAPRTLPTLDEKYPTFSKRVFGDKECPWQPVNVYLFQPGLQNHHAHISTGGHIVWIPERMDTVEHLFSAIEQAFAMPSSSMRSTPDSTSSSSSWEDPRILYPRFFSSKAAIRFRRLRSQGARVGFAAPPEFHDHGYFAQAFPQCHRAYRSSKAKDRGWIHYTNGVLKVCRGRSRRVAASTIKKQKHRGAGSTTSPMTSTPPSMFYPESFRAGHCFDPLDDSCVVGKVQHTFTSLQELLCAAESLWDKK